jgi:hypothetical protein
VGINNAETADKGSGFSGSMSLSVVSEFSQVKTKKNIRWL